MSEFSYQNQSAVSPLGALPEPQHTGGAGYHGGRRHASGGSLKTSLREVGQIVKRRKWTILAVTLLVAGLVGAYVALSSPTYEASTVLLVEEPSAQRGVEQDPLSSGRIGAVDRRQRNMTDQALLLQQSFAIARQTVQRVRERHGEIEGPVTLLEAEGPSEAALAQTARRLQKSYVSVSREAGEEGNALRITATSTNPHEAAFIANAYTEAYLDLAEQSSRRRIEAAQSFLEDQVARQEEKLRRYEGDIEDYMSRTGTAGLEEETRQTVQQMGELEARLDEARVERRRAEAALQSVEGELEEIRPRLADRVASGVDEEITRAQGRIADLEARLEQIYIKNPGLRENPSRSDDVADLNEQVAGLRSRVSRLTGQYIDEMMAVGGTDPFASEGGSSISYVAQLKREAARERVNVNGSQARINALRERLGQYGQRMEDIPERSTRIARLRREQTSAEELYTSLSKKLQDVRLAREATISMADVVQPAQVPSSPVMPRALILFVGLLLGLSAGVLAAVARHKMDSRVYTPEDLTTRGFNTLGIVPDLQLVEGHERLLGNGEGGGGKKDAAAEANGQAVPALRGPGSDAATEAYRRLHMSVQFARYGEHVQTVLVTSPDPGAGKSTTAFNLAVAAARAGQRTLLVDADLRKPQMQRFLDASEGAALTDLLEDSEMPIETDRLATSIENLHAVTLREPVGKADTVLSSPAMTRLIARLREHFDLIVFDTPPVMAVADATFLAAQCDATLVVARAGQTDAEELEQTHDELREAHADLFGTVLNRFDPSESSSYTTRYRYQDYYYGSPED